MLRKFNFYEESNTDDPVRPGRTRLVCDVGLAHRLSRDDMFGVERASDDPATESRSLFALAHSDDAPDPQSISRLRLADGRLHAA